MGTIELIFENKKSKNKNGDTQSPPKKRKVERNLSFVAFVLSTFLFLGLTEYVSIVIDIVIYIVIDIVIYIVIDIDIDI